MTWNFNEANLPTIEKYYPYYLQAQRSGRIRISSYIIDQVFEAYRIATGHTPNKGCGACINDAFRMLFRNYELYKESNERKEAISEGHADVNVSTNVEEQP
jgi:hypothetical protein